MKKVILSLAIFAATSLSMMAANDNNNATGNEKTRTECCKEKGECKKGDRQGKKDGKFDRADRGMRAFEGLNLTDAQKTKIEELQKQCKEAREKEMKAFKEQKDQNRDKKDRKDLTDAEKQQLKAEKEKRKAEMQAQRKQQMQNFLNGVKSILTPEQYTQFLENNFMMAGNNHQKGMKKGGKQMRGQKGMQANKGKNGMRSQKDMQKGQQGQKSQRQATALPTVNA